MAVILDGDKFLTIKRSATVRAPGQYCFPGGGIERGESNEQALVREMQEELNIAVRPLRRLWQSQSSYGTVLNWWLAELEPNQTIVPNTDEVEVFDWMTIGEIRSQSKLLASNAAFFDALEAGEFDLNA